MSATATIARDSLAPVGRSDGSARLDAAEATSRPSPAEPPGGKRSTRLAVLVSAQALVHTLEQGVFATLTYELVGRGSVGIGGNGLLQALQALPLLLLALPLGAMADRRFRNVLVAVAEAIRFCVYLGIAAAGVTGAQLPATVWLALLTFALASGSAVHAVGLPSVVPRLVDSRPQLLRTNSGLEIAKTLGYMIGPAIFGWILASGGLRMVGEAASVLVLASACGLWHAIGSPAHSSGKLAQTMLPTLDGNSIQAAAAAAVQRRGIASVLDDVREGLRFARSVPLLKTILTAQSIYSLGFCCLCVALMPHLVVKLGLGVQAAAAVVASQGAGMFAGAIAAPIALRRLGAKAFLRLTTAIAFIAGLSVLASSLTGSVALAALGMVLLGVGPMAWTVGVTTLRQLATPSALQGRLAALNTATMGLRVVGALLGAAVGATLGMLACFALAAVLMAGFMAVAWGSKALESNSLPRI